MKTKLFLSFLLSFSFYLLSSQVPQGFNYQAIARDGSSGDPITGKTMQVRIGILSDTIANTMVWEELFNPVRTNAFGMFNIVVGTGVKQSGSATTFSAIDWTKTPLFLRTSIYYPSSWKVMGTSKLQSVPYSMVAGSLEGAVPLLSVKGNTATMDSALFVVRNNTGQIVFAVYNEGVRIYVDDGKAKGATKGGFAIGSFDRSKGTSQPLFVVDPDSIRAYLDNNPVKAVKGGFAIGSFDRSKSATQNFLSVSKDSIRMYIDDNLTTKSSKKGGFAIGSFDKSKGGNINYLNVSTDSTGIINPSENRILWYPLKDAFLTGKVLIESKDSVGVNSFASGFQSKSKGKYSQALGYQAISRGDYSTAIGKNALANKINSFAFGDSARAINSESYAIGRGAISSGYRSFAFGSAGVDTAGKPTDVTRALGDYSFSIGQGSKSIGNGSFSIGIADTSKGDYSVAIGYKSIAGASAIALGYHNNASGAGSTAMGYFSTASGINSTCMGYFSTASGYSSTAMGQQCLASMPASTAMGELTKATGWYSTAIGYGTKASGGQSTAIGLQTVASAQSSIAMGTVDTASGWYSTAMGYGTKASNYYSTAMGYYTKASGYYSTAMGPYTQASGNSSTSMGYFTQANGNYTTTMGYETKAIGLSSTAMGYQTNAAGDISTVMGSYTMAKPLASLAIGQYNDTTCSSGGKISWVLTDPVFIIGNGTTNNSRSNAMTVLKNGNVGIGTSTPVNLLSVKGTRSNAIFSSTAIAQIGGADVFIYFGALNGTPSWDTWIQPLRPSDNYPFNLLLCPAGGNVEIGTTSTGYKLQVGNAGDGTQARANAWNLLSDIRYKTGFEYLNDALSKISEIKGFYFYWNTGTDKTRQFGLSAQDVEKVLPEVVSKGTDGYLSVDYGKLTPLLIEGIKDQQKQIESQQKEIDELKTLVNTLVANQGGQGNK